MDLSYGHWMKMEGDENGALVELGLQLSVGEGIEMELTNKPKHFP